MEYSIEQIIDAALERKELFSDEKRKNRIIFRTEMGVYLPPSDAKNVKSFLDLLEEKLDIKLQLIAGGWGCTKFEFEIIDSCGRSASEIIKRILADKELLSKAIETKFKVILDPSRQIRQNLEEVSVKNKKDNPVNISISDSTINGIKLNSTDNQDKELNTKIKGNEKMEKDSKIVIGTINGKTNINSVDNSINLTSSSNMVFDNLKNAILGSSLNNQEKEKMILDVNNMEDGHKNGSFTKRYQEFMQNAANHMTLLSPFIPELSKLLS